MKKTVTLFTLLSLSLPLLAFPQVSHADVELGVDVPGLSLHIGDQDRRGYYWDGDDWRDPDWWHHHRHHEGRWVWVEEPPHHGPPPPHWHDGWRDDGPPHWHDDGPPPGWHHDHD